MWCVVWKFARWTQWSCTFLLCFSLTGCLTEGTGSEDQTEIVAVPEEAPVDTPILTPPERTLCDPFSAGSSAQDRGLIGNLLYLTDDQPRYSSVTDYMENATPIESTLYFNQLYVPTRKFDLGFYRQDGTLVLNQNDEPIYEYFALRMESQFTLAAGDEEGWYQMAVLSDDGAMLRERLDDNSLVTIVDNDGTHPTRMGCASEAIYMDHNSARNLIFEYFQGPRYHISLVVMMRKLEAGEDPANPDMDLQCGKAGNSMYFDYNQVPSAPTATYYDMLTRGWKALNNENYYFPEQANNPCAVEDPLVITNFSIVSSTRTEVTVSWTTSLPASSQIEVKDVIAGSVESSSLDSTLKTNHQVTFSGLSANTLYSVKGLSVSDGGQEVSSSESAFRTPR